MSIIVLVGQCHKSCLKLTLNGLNFWEFDESFIKSWKLIKDIFFKLMFNVMKTYMTFSMIYHFHVKNENWKSGKAYH